MSQEISLNASLSINNPAGESNAVGKSVTNALYNQTSALTVCGTMLAGTTATLVGIGQITTPHWSYWRNKDASNFVQLLNGSTPVARLLPGEESPIPLDPTGTYSLIADTAPVQVEFLVAGA